MHLPTPEEVVHYGTYLVTVCSILHTALPPVGEFGEFPRFQKAYAFLVKLIEVIALGGRDKSNDRLPHSTNPSTSGGTNVVS